MSEKPILFSSPMIRALLAGAKTQTRRIVFGKQTSAFDASRDCFDASGYDTVTDAEIVRVPWTASAIGVYIRCPYAVGDRLWVRETWASPEENKSIPGRVAYDADGLCGCWIGGGEDREFIYHGRILQASGYHECFPENGSSTFGLGKYSDIRSGEYPSYRYGWRPSIFMPRWASRITLEVTNVRCQRLQDISEEDARAEGIQVLPLQSADDPSAWWQSAPGEHQERTPRASFAQLWISINGKRTGCSWADNPWVWAYTFRRLA